MNKNPYAYAYWIVLAFVFYAVVGLFTEHEFLLNPIWLFTGKPAPGFCSYCQTDFVLILIVIALIPLALWLRSKSTGSRALISRKNLGIGIAILLVGGFVIGFFVLQREWREERESQTQYDLGVRNDALVRDALSRENSPLEPYFMNLVVADGVATVYFTRAAASLLDTASERSMYLKPLETALLRLLGVNAVQWGVGPDVLYRQI